MGIKNLYKAFVEAQERESAMIAELKPLPGALAAVRKTAEQQAEAAIRKVRAGTMTEAAFSHELEKLEKALVPKVERLEADIETLRMGIKRGGDSMAKTVADIGKLLAAKQRKAAEGQNELRAAMREAEKQYHNKRETQLHPAKVSYDKRVNNLKKAYKELEDKKADEDPLRAPQFKKLQILIEQEQRRGFGLSPEYEKAVKGLPALVDDPVWKKLDAELTKELARLARKFPDYKRISDALAEWSKQRLV